MEASPWAHNGPYIDVTYLVLTCLLIHRWPIDSLFLDRLGRYRSIVVNRGKDELELLNHNSPGPSMASSDPGSDSDVPESFSLTQAKKTAQSRNKALKQSHADEKRKKKERNRARDRGLKERAELRKRERAENDVVSRMERAMRDAREENSEVDEDRLEMSTEGANEDEMGGEMGDEDEDEDIDSDDEIISNKISEEEDLTSSNPNPKHLPEHLFASTFIPTPEKNKISASRKKQIHKKDTKKRRPHRIKPKDFVLG